MPAKKEEPKNQIKLNSINFITPEELAVMPAVAIEVTKTFYPAKNNRPASERYEALCRFDSRGLVKYPLKVDRDTWALLHYSTGKSYPGNTFIVPGKARLIETQWPATDTRRAHSSFRLEVYVDEDLKWDADVTYDNFLKVFKKGLAKGDVNGVFAPYARIPGKQEGEPIPPAKPELVTEDMPF